MTVNHLVGGSIPSQGANLRERMRSPLGNMTSWWPYILTVWAIIVVGSGAIIYGLYCIISLFGV